MRHLNFHYARAKNFLCFGPEGIELNFDKLGDIINIRGENLDTKPVSDDVEDDRRKSSNGSGKSTIPEILCWGLYGETIKNPKKIKVDDVVHNKIKKGCEVEIIVNDMRILRKREPASLELWISPDHIWDDKTKQTLGKGTQAEINKNLPLSYKAFVNVVVFTDDSKMSFLESDGPTKREIIENLLSLEKYRDWHKQTNDVLKEFKKSIKTMASEWEMLVANVITAEKHVANVEIEEKQWVAARRKEFDNLMLRVSHATLELKATDHGDALLKFQAAQERIKELSASNPEMEQTYEKKAKIAVDARATLEDLKEKARKAKEEHDDLQRHIKDHQEKIANRKKVIADLSGKAGTKCPVCYGKVEECNYKHVIQEAENVISSSEAKLEKDLTAAKALMDRVSLLLKNQEKTKAFIEAADKQVNTLAAQLKAARKELVECSQVREPKAAESELLLEQQLSELKNQATAKKREIEGPTPFVQVLLSAKNDVIKAAVKAADKERELKESEKQVPYYEYWLKAFGDDGIRKWVVDGIIPTLNSQITYWLQFLIDNKIQLKFDNQLDETIERVPADSDPFVYHAMSGGERRRLNLAVSQAFAHIMMMNSGAVPSLVFLDEVSTNIDPVGIDGIYKMICELAREKQVFVTTHDQDLLKMLDGCRTLHLQKEHGITKMIQPEPPCIVST